MKKDIYLILIVVLLLFALCIASCDKKTTEPKQVASPVFHPGGVIYNTAQNVSISCATPDATIRYTTDGSNPGSSSLVYSAPISVSQNTTLKARAFKEGWADSKIVEADYIIIEIIYVSGGTFHNGSSNVTLSSFYIDKYQTTQANYEAVMGINPAFFFDNSKHPVEQVNWYNAIEYCNRRSIMEALTPCYQYDIYGTNPDNWPSGWNTLSKNHTNVSRDWTGNGYRLPTEMEWMFAAKGGNQSQGYTYAGSNNLDDVAWYWGNSSLYGTKPVGKKLPNELGIYDMSGNVFEWCWDRYGDYPHEDQTNPHGVTIGSKRVMRGGSWIEGSPFMFSVSYRRSLDADLADNIIGFRCVRDAP